MTSQHGFTRTALAALMCLAAACGASTPTNPGAGAPAALAIVGDSVITIEAGASRTLTVEQRDAAGRVVPTPASSYEWTTDRPEVLAVSAGELRAGELYGSAVITVTSPEGLAASVHVWVQPRPRAGALRIKLIFADGVPDFWRRELAEAAGYWMRMMHAALPAVTLNNPSHACGVAPGQPPVPPMLGVETGVRVYVGLGTFPSRTYVEAVGGPCLQRPLPYPTTLLGAVTVNPDKFGNIEPDRLRYLAYHEVGHALGLVGVVQGRQPDWFDATHESYRGPFGLEGFRRQTGVRASVIGVPGAHWPFREDIMGNVGGNVDAGPATIGGLMDLGYPVRW